MVQRRASSTGEVRVWCAGPPPCRCGTSRPAGPAQPTSNESASTAHRPRTRAGLLVEAEDRDVGRQVPSVDPGAGVHTVLHHSAHEVPGGRSPVVPGFVHRPRRVLVPVDRIACGGASLNVGLDGFQQRQELGLVVEGVDDHVATLVPFGVVPVLPHHEPADAVVPHIDPGHDTRLGRRRGRRPWSFGGPTGDGPLSFPGHV